MAVSDINVLAVSGRVGTEPETRDAGKSRVTRWRFAISDAWGNDQERTHWITAEVWNREGVATFISKGDLLFLSGQLQIDEWTDSDGNPRRETIIRVHEIRKGGRSGNVARRQEPAGKPGTDGDDELPW